MAKQLEQMSLEELEKLALSEGVEVSSPDDLESLSEAELVAIAQQEGADIPAPKEKIKQEAHPLFQGLGGALNRARLKNFANTPEDIVRTIKAENPDIEVKLSDEGQVILKSPGDKEFSVLDPGGFSLSDLPQDIADVGVDVLSGIAEAGAGALGAGAGALAGGGIGAVPGAIGGAAAAGAATDTARQLLGQALGIEQEFDPGSVGTAAAFAGAGAGLFGSGTKAVKAATKGNVIKNELKSLFAEKPVGKELSEGTQRFIESGLIPNLSSKGTAKAGQIFTGIKGKIFERVAENPEKFKDIDSIGIENYVQTKMEPLFDAVNQAKSEAGAQVDAVISQSDASVDVAGALGKGLEATKALADKPLATKKARQFRDELKAQLDAAFAIEDAAGNAVALEGEIPVGVAQQIKNNLDELIDFQADSQNPNKSLFSKRLQNNLKAARKELNDRITRAVPEAKKANELFQEKLDERNFIINNFSQNRKDGIDNFTEKGFNKLKAIGNDRKTNLKKRLSELDAKYGTDVADSSQDIAAHGLYTSDAFTPTTLGGTTSTTRTALGSLVGAGVGQNLGESSEGRIGGAALGALILGNPRVFKGAVRASEATRRGLADDVPFMLKNLSQELLRRDQESK